MDKWTHPMDREGASEELRLLATASFLIEGAKRHTPVGREIAAPEWAWAVVEAAKERYPGYRTETLMCDEWQEERAACARVAEDQERLAKQAREDELGELVLARDIKGLASMGATKEEIFSVAYDRGGEYATAERYIRNHARFGRGYRVLGRKRG